MADPETQSENSETLPQEFIDDESDSTVASKAMAGGVLIVLGAVLALWLGPKIAPALPSGMAPVAAWLTPGGALSDAAIADLRIELNARLDGLPPQMSRTDVEGIVAGQTDDLATQITGLSDQISATDGTAIESRLATLELKTDGLRAELSALTAQLTAASATGGSLSTENTAQIATYAAALEGLKAEIAMLAAQNGALSQRIDLASATADRQVAEAEVKVVEATHTVEAEISNAAIQATLNAIEVAISEGRPFETALTEFTAAGGGTVSGPLADASGGVVTMSELRADFPEAAHAAIRASITASAGDGLLSSAGAFLRAQVATRSLTPQEGPAPDAVLSRAEAALKRDDLAGAMAEIEALPSVSTDADGPMADWLAGARKRLEALTAYEALALATQTEIEAAK